MNRSTARRVVALAASAALIGIAATASTAGAVGFPAGRQSASGSGLTMQVGNLPVAFESTSHSAPCTASNPTQTAHLSARVTVRVTYPAGHTVVLTVGANNGFTTTVSPAASPVKIRVVRAGSPRFTCGDIDRTGPNPTLNFTLIDQTANTSIQIAVVPSVVD